MAHFAMVFILPSCDGMLLLLSHLDHTEFFSIDDAAGRAQLHENPTALEIHSQTFANITIRPLLLDVLARV